MLNINGVELEWLGHAGFMIRKDKTIYIDPFKIIGKEPADILLITHSHYDHCSLEDIRKISNENTIIVTTPDCQSKLSSIKAKNVTLVEPGNKLNVNGISLEIVPAYNINKQFHPKDNGWVGYIITINGLRIYHSGDSDATPEIKALQNIDVALLPVSGTYVMTAEEAAQAVNTFKPKLAVPMHYGSGVAGTRDDAERFKQLCQVDVKIMG